MVKDLRNVDSITKKKKLVSHSHLTFFVVIIMKLFGIIVFSYTMSVYVHTYLQ